MLDEIVRIFIFIFLGTSFLSQELEENNDAPTVISGCVISELSNNNYPLDSPKLLTYEIKAENGTLFNISYTSYPPSPVGEIMKKKISLNFINGSILPGNYIIASGDYDVTTNTLKISKEGSFIETSIF
jgi:hypothetical protein